MVASLVGPICDDGLWINGRIYKHTFHGYHIKQKILDGSHVDKLGTSTGPWPRYLVVTSMDKGKSLNNLAIHKGVKSIAGGAPLLSVILMVTFICYVVVKTLNGMIYSSVFCLSMLPLLL